MARVSMPVLVVALLCDLAACGLALGAMVKRSKAVPTYSEPGYLTCGYTKDIATGLAATAFVLLLFGQVLITTVTNCFCFEKANYHPGSGRILSVCTLVTSWFTFVIAEIFLLSGAILNNIRSIGQVDEGVTSQDEVNCAHAKKLIFAIGAAFAFLTMLLSLGYYFLQAGAKSKENQWNSYRTDMDPDSDPYLEHDHPHIGMTAYN